MFRILISIINRITKSKIDGLYYEYPVLVGIPMTKMQTGYVHFTNM